MSFINYKNKEIHCKVVYYGPSLSGKTTNIQWVYHKTADNQKSKLIALNTDIERTLFFDFLPLSMGDVQGYRTRFHLYTVPGQVVYDSSRKLILKGIDGVIFVADSQRERQDENLESVRNLEINLNQQGYNIHDIPLVFQYNKRDLKGIIPIDELSPSLNKFNVPEFEAIASQGVGVMESLKVVTSSIVAVLKGGDLSDHQNRTRDL